MVSKRVKEAYELYRQGFSYEEIANRMGINVKTVRKYIYKARKEIEGVEERIVAKKKESTKIKELENRIEELERAIRELEEKIDRLWADTSLNKGDIKLLIQRIVQIERKIEEANKTISVPKPISITEQMQKAISDYEKLIEIAKKYYEIQKLLGNLMVDDFSFESTYSWRRKIDRKGYYTTFGRFYGIAHVTTVEDWWKGKRELKEWYIVWLQGRKLLTKDEVIKRIPTIKKHLIEAISKLPKIIERDLPRHPENAEKVEKLYNELIELIKGGSQ